nr:MAG TPA: hypothetical protein [Caudoviricetes sp.]
MYINKKGLFRPFFVSFIPGKQLFTFALLN